MAKKDQPEQDKHRPDDHKKPSTGDTSDGTGRVDDTNEPAEAEAVDDATPTNEPQQETADRR